MAKKPQTTQDYQNTFKKLGYTFRYNEVKDVNEVNGQVIDTHKESEIICKMNDQGFYQESRIVRQIYFEAGNNRYNPIKAYLQSLSYDGTNYIKKLCDNYIDGDQFTYPWLHRCLVSSVGKIFTLSQSPVLVIDGPQNIGKSQLIKWLASKLKSYFVEGDIKPDQKDAKIRAASNWIWEVHELGSTTRRADVDSLKGFLTQTYISERPAYARQDKQRPVTATFIGTINNGASGFLNDPSGNRRFMITTVKNIDWQGYTKNIDPDQVWGQAFTEWQMGEPTELTADEMKASSANNEEYKVSDPVTLAIEEKFKVDTSGSFVATSEMIEALRNSPIIRSIRDDDLAKRIADYMAANGGEKGKGYPLNKVNQVRGYKNVVRI
ncbi:MAG: VapE family protein [Anaerolineaceae bacterium]|nr:VapE family protein [Anaerolineaceae bacterium]